MGFLFRILFLLLPVFIIYWVYRAYMANKQAAEEQWKDQWDQKKKNFQLEQELKKQEQKIKDLEFRLKEEEKLKSDDS